MPALDDAVPEPAEIKEEAEAELAGVGQ